MPFAVTNQKTINLGGGLRFTRGQWTGAAGDAPGTLTIQGGRVWSAQFYDNVSSAVVEAPATFTASGNVLTVTVNNIATVNSGHFGILHS